MFPYDLVFTAGILSMFFLLALASYVGSKVADRLRGQPAPVVVAPQQYAGSSKKAA